MKKRMKNKTKDSKSLKELSENKLLDTGTINEKLINLENLLTHDIRTNKGNSPEIAFAISLKSKRSSKNWDRVQENLSKTLRSIFRNTDQNYRIIVAGHKKPIINELNHEKVTWLRVRFSPPKSPKGFSRDKMHKRKVIGNYLRKVGFSGYFMPIDADDWIHYRFIEYIRNCPLSDAFIINKGFMFNLFNENIWMRKQSFYKGCGTSQILYFNNNELPKSALWNATVDKNFEVVLKSHVFIKEFLKKRNKMYTLVEFPLITWVLAHGDNNSIILGKHDLNISAIRYQAEEEKFDSRFYNYFKVLD
ncbi:hypothetical protein [Metabacillus schmidteae]|uniref:hypothetical protein n=1 Tax=Metabacillus schmidteae TaxID=2730405 RepID=UPI00158A6916|nr:hypothetical protein [Metabacillus schmidteae]